MPLPRPDAAVRNLLLNLVRRELSLRYKSTLLGFFWSFLKPLALTGIFWLVFDKILDIQLREEAIPFTLHLLPAMLAWTFFAGATGDAMTSVLNNANLIRKVRLPLGVFPLAAVCSHMVHFLLALVVLFVLLIFGGLPPTIACLLLPPILLLHFALTLAVSLVLSALNVFYRDVASVWEVLTQAWFYGTPILYAAYMATDKLDQIGLGWAKWLYLANPLTPIMIAYRRVLVYAPVQNPSLEMPDGELLLALGVSTLMTAVLLVGSWVLFRRLSRSFADVL